MSSSVHDILSTSGKRVCTFVWSVFRLLCGVCIVHYIGIGKLWWIKKCGG